MHGRKHVGLHDDLKVMGPKLVGFYGEWLVGFERGRNCGWEVASGTKMEV